MESECPQCTSKAFKRNGYTRHGKQNHRCLDCGRQFSLEPVYAPNTHSNVFIGSTSSPNAMESGFSA